MFNSVEFLNKATMKKTLATLLVLSTLISINLKAQQMDNDYYKTFNDAEYFFTNENYPDALPLYIALDKKIPGNANMNFKIGYCYLNSPTYKIKAIPFLEFAIKNIAKQYEEGEIKEKGVPLSTLYYLGNAYQLNYEFDKAIAMYHRYIDELGKNSNPIYSLNILQSKKILVEMDDVKHSIETCNNGKELVLHPQEILTITNLGPNINSKYADYSPSLSLDEKTIFFSSRREGGINATKELNGLYYEDIYESHYENDKWQPAILDGTRNTMRNEATLNISTDGKTLLIYKDDNGNGNIYQSEFKNDKWSTPEKMAPSINSSSWETHAYLTVDKNILYFVSDRPGGYGGRDIYKCLKLANGEWGVAENLGPKINTKYDEDGLFISPDGQTIYFASKGHKSMGGFDIFKSEISDEKGNWSNPENIGYPLNTTDDDVFYVTSADGGRAYLSSDKEGGFGEKDIYVIGLKKPNQLVMSGKFITDTNGKIGDNSIVFTNAKTGAIAYSLVAEDSSGKFETDIAIGPTYKIVYKIKGVEVFSEELETKGIKGNKYIIREIPYNVAESNLDTKENNTNSVSFQYFYKYNQNAIDPSSAKFITFIDELYASIKSNSANIIDIESSASKVPTKTFKSNKELAEKRAANVKNIIIAALNKRSVNKMELHFKEHSFVQGPNYVNDSHNSPLTYEPYQYIKIGISKIETKKREKKSVE